MSNTNEQFSLFDTPQDAAEEEQKSSLRPAGEQSNFIVYVDESGDHGMQTVDQNYPIFVLAFCVFYKRHYSDKVVPAIEKFKFNRFGHDIVILHERDIRKEITPFKFNNHFDKNEFLGQLSEIIERSNFILISCVVKKDSLSERQSAGDNLYHLALGFCLDTLHEFLSEKSQDDKKTFVVFESRGKKEDKDLELEFRRVCDGANRKNARLPFEIILADKRSNSSGLQLADLVARPIGLNILRPKQENRAFDILKQKFFCAGGRKNVGEGYEGWGLKVFPPLKSEKPR